MDETQDRSQLWSYVHPTATWFPWLRGRWDDDARRAMAEVQAAVLLTGAGQDDAALRLLGGSPIANWLHASAVVYAAAAVVVHDGNHGSGRLLGIVHANDDRDTQYVDTDTPEAALTRRATHEFYAMTGALASSMHGGPDADLGPLVDAVRAAMDSETPCWLHLFVGVTLLGGPWAVPPQVLSAALAEIGDHASTGGAA